MATTKAISANNLNQGSATVGVKRTGTDRIQKWDGSASLRPAYQTNKYTQYDARDTSSRFDDYGLRRKTIEIGTWDMDATASVTVAHSLSATEWTKIRSVELMIRNDAGLTATYYNDSTDTSANADGGIEVTSIDATNVTLNRADSGTFDSVSFNDTADSYNRGWITVWYE